VLQLNSASKHSLLRFASVLDDRTGLHTAALYSGQAYNFDCCAILLLSWEAYWRRPFIAGDAANVAERKEPR
jgi:hypothetical protein